MTAGPALDPHDLAAFDESLLPSEEDVRFYEEHGWYVSRPGVVTPQARAALGAAVARFRAGERDRELPTATGRVDWTPGDPAATRINEHASYRLHALRQALLQPVLGAIAARLARTDEIRLMEDTLIQKDPLPDAGTGGTGWHTDDAYSSNCTSRDTLTVWVPLHDVDRDRAPLVVLDGSHRWPGTDHLREFNSQDLDRVRARFEAEGNRVVEIPLVLTDGRVSFHHARTVHGSYPNRSTSERVAFAVQLQDGKNEYQDFWNDGRQIHHYLDGVCRRTPDGSPDYRDPEVFPVVWRDRP